MDRTITVRLVASIGQYQAQMGAAAAQTRGFGQGVVSAAKEGNVAMQALGKGMLVAGGLLAAGLAISVGKAMEFEREMRNVNSITKQSEAQFADTSNQVLALSRTVPQSAAILAKGLYDIASSGFAGADGMKILEASAIGATAGMTTTDVSAKAITATLNAYGRQASDAEDISDVLFKTVEVGVITFEELASGMGDWVGMAAAAKVPVDEAAAAIAAMTLSGVSAAESGTSLNRVLTSIISPSEELANKLAELGYESGAQALETDGLRGVMEKLRGATGGNITELQALFPEVRALRGALALTANEGQNFGRTFDAITDKQKRAGAAQAAYIEQSKALSVQWELTKSSMGAFAIEVGNRLLPMLSSAAGFVGGLFDAFSGLPGPLITAGTAVAGLTAIALTLGGTLLVLAPRIAATNAALLAMGPAGIAASNGLGKMFSVLGRAAVLIGFTLLLKEAGEAVQNLYTVRADSSKLIGDLEHLAATGEVTGETLRVFGTDLDGLAKGVENIGSRGWVDKFNEALNTMDTGAEASRKGVHELDAAFAEYATNGNPDGAAAAFGLVTEALLAQGLSIEAVRAAFPEYLAAKDDAKAKADALSVAYEAEQEVLASLGAEIGETTLKTEEQTEAQKMLQKVYDSVSSSIEGFTNPMDAYRAALEANTAAAQAEGQAALDRAEDVEEGNQLAGKSWEDYAEVATVSLGQVLEELNKQDTAFNNWADNLAKIAARGRGDLAIELAKLGPEAAVLVQAFADDTTPIFEETADAWIRNTRRGQDGSAQEIVKGGLVQNEFARQGANATVETVAAALDLLPGEVKRIVDEANKKLREGEPGWNESWGNRTRVSLDEMQTVLKDAPPKMREAAEQLNQHLIDTNPEFARQFQSRHGVSVEQMNAMLRDAPPVARDAADTLNRYFQEREPAWGATWARRAGSAVSAMAGMRRDAPPIAAGTGDDLNRVLADRHPAFKSTVGRYQNTLVGGINTVFLASNGRGGLHGIEVGNAADGAIVEFFAKGGMKEKHQAQIARAGDWRVWAEPETGGEAYIPLSPAKRDRSTAILEEVADRFGLSLTDLRDLPKGVDYHDGGLYVPPGAPGLPNYGPPIRPAGEGTMVNAREFTASGPGSICSWPTTRLLLLDRAEDREEGREAMSPPGCDRCSGTTRARASPRPTAPRAATPP